MLLHKHTKMQITPRRQNMSCNEWCCESLYGFVNVLSWDVCTLVSYFLKPTVEMKRITRSSFKQSANVFHHYPLWLL